jgi:hypothetical protein
MNKLFAKIVLGSTALGLAGGVAAGDWEVWTQNRAGPNMVIMTSFAGDGSTEEAHLDLEMAVPFEVVHVDTLQKGAVCVASKERNVLRAVPPSGAGQPLAKNATEACMFTIRVKGNPTLAEIVKVSFAECTSSVTGDVPCAAKVQALK